jgi:hypothetical protein
MTRIARLAAPALLALAATGVHAVEVDPQDTVRVSSADVSTLAPALPETLPHAAVGEIAPGDAGLTPVDQSVRGQPGSAQDEPMAQPLETQLPTGA